MAGPHFPTSPVTAQLVLQRWRIVSFDVMQTFNNVQSNGRSCSPKHGPGHFTVLKNLFVWMKWSFSKTFELVAELCSPKHGPVLFTVLNNLFVWMLCSHVKTFKFMAGPHFPTCSVTAQLILRRWKIVSLWCCADIQQRSNERLVVLPQTRPSSFHGVEELFCLDVMQPFKHIQVDGWAALPNIPCHGPAHFASLRNRFVLMFCKHSTTFKWTDVRAPLNTVQSISRCWKIFFVWMKWSFSKTFELVAGLCFPKHGPVLFTVLKNLFVWMFCSHVKTLKFMPGPRSPTSPFTAQLISRRWRIVLFCSCADNQQRSNERMVVLPQTRSNAFHGFEKHFSS